jgi:hypothetical protein
MPPRISPSSPLCTAALVAALLLPACAPDTGAALPEADAGRADADPGDDRATLERAVDIIAASDYISFSYSADGCHDRSILMAAELAAAGIPSNAQFIVPYEDELTPRQHAGLEWNYHVAPVIFVAGAPSDEQRFLTFAGGEVAGEIDPGAYIVDPALYPDDIVAPLETWIADLTGEGQSGFLAMDDARAALDVPADEARGMEQAAASTIPAGIDEMPRLWQFQLGSACGFLSRDAGELEGELGAPAIEQIRRDMNAGVIDLLERMLEQNLLLETKPVPDHPCWDF